VSGPVRAVLVDLDDTLYPQASYLDLAWRAVADRGARRGLDHDTLLAALHAAAAQGSARGGIIDRALVSIAAAPEHVADLLAAFRAVVPDRLPPYAGVAHALRALRAVVPVALVTDGEVTGQQRKLAALGLGDMFDVVVFSDRRGREHRKPHPLPFQDALAGLGVAPRDAVMIGDRPDKDVVGAVGAGARAIRVGTGEYAALPDHPATWFRADTFAGAVTALLPHLAAA
jgi:putative hydrolase of the HAD superfamily